MTATVKWIVQSKGRILSSCWIKPVWLSFILWNTNKHMKNVQTTLEPTEFTNLHCFHKKALQLKRKEHSYTWDCTHWFSVWLLDGGLLCSIVYFFKCIIQVFDVFFKLKMHYSHCLYYKTFKNSTQIETCLMLLDQMLTLTVQKYTDSYITLMLWQHISGKPSSFWKGIL